MKGRNKWWLSLGVAAATVSLANFSPASAAHTGGPVTLLDKAGVAVSTSGEPYSPKTTCGQCHNYGSGEDNSGASMTGPGDGVMDHIVQKHQGSMASNGEVYFQTYDVTSYSHGISVGRHMNQGRNEDYTGDMRNAFALPWFTSSLGMWGKY